MKNYVPRPGTRSAAALNALVKRPMSTSTLANAIDCAVGSVNASIQPALDHGLIIKLKDSAGLLHFALASKPIDDGFAEYSSNARTPHNAPDKQLTDAPLVRKTTSPPEISAEARAAAAPFGLNRPVNSPAQYKDDQQPHEGLASGATLGRRSPAVAPTITPTQPADDGFMAGMFSNGEIVITLGPQYIKLTPNNARQLRALLNNYQEQA